jgi:hypothetical protein
MPTGPLAGRRYECQEQITRKQLSFRLDVVITKDESTRWPELRYQQSHAGPDPASRRGRKIPLTLPFAKGRNWIQAPVSQYGTGFAGIRVSDSGFRVSGVSGLTVSLLLTFPPAEIYDFKRSLLICQN